MRDTIDTQAVVGVLNEILELELAGVVRYTHYSFMVFGYNRIPIVSWLRSQADDGMMHAHKAGEIITQLGEHPSLGIGKLLESHNHDIGSILKEALTHETEILDSYYKLLDLVAGKSIFLEEYAREMIATEEMHAAEVDKMLRKPGDIHTYSPNA